MNTIKSYTNSSFIETDHPKLSYGFFTRNGGISDGLYESLNCGYGSHEDVGNIVENRRRVASSIGCKNESLLSVYQVHGKDVETVQAIWDDRNRPHADAMVTDKAGIALGILTADCAPVLFYGKKGDGSPVIGAAHAGWQGALKGVLENTIKTMIEIGADIKSMNACVGPCISKASYEVSESFMTPFLDKNERSEIFFHEGAKPEKLHFDLSGYCCWRLSMAGVKNVTLMDIDTYKKQNEFFSYRRTTHNNEKDYGRQISVILIKE